MAVTSSLLLAPDPYDWQAKREYFAHLRIENREGQLVPFVPKPGQDRLYSFLEMQHRATGRMRLLVLKERQEEGMSTAVEALIDEETTRFAHKRAAVAAHDIKATAELWKRVKRFQDYKPAELLRPIRASSVHEIQYAPPHDSCFRVLTAGDHDMGAAGTLDWFHGSEVAREAYTEAGLVSVLNSLSNAEHTGGVLESTAQGAAGVFYDMVIKAAEHARRHPTDLRGWQLLFFSWLRNPECVTEPPQGWECDPYDEAVAALKTAQVLDPLSSVLHTALGQVYLCAGKHDLALAEFEMSLALGEDNRVLRAFRGESYLHEGKYELARADFERASEMSGSFDPLIELGWARAREATGETGALEASLTKAREHGERQRVSPYWLAAFCFALGRNDEGFSLLERAYAERDFELIFLAVDPRFLSCHSDPRHGCLLRMMGLAD